MKLCNSFIYLYEENDKNFKQKLENFLKKTYRLNANKKLKKTLVICNDLKNKHEINFDNNFIDSFEIIKIEEDSEFENLQNLLKKDYNISMIKLSNLTKDYLERFLFDYFL